MMKTTDASGRRKADWLDEQTINRAIEQAQPPDRRQIDEIIAKSLELKGLSFNDVAILCRAEAEDLLAPVFVAAKRVKEAIYGRRIVLFAPLYISNLCANECLYCAFRRSNSLLTRRALDMEEIRRETLSLLDQGHKRVLMVAGESYPSEEGFSYIIKAIEAIYGTKNSRGDCIRRINANVAPLGVDEFRELKAAGIGTYQLFQETYHRETYKNVHRGGKKIDYDWRLTGMDRAMEAGIDDVGIGPLLGLADWRFEVLGMMTHIQHLEKEFGVGCHTISVPRIEPAVGSDMASSPPHAVSDRDFKKLVAILRLAVPYTGMIMSTRENAEMREATLEMGISQISAGSCTDPGGYADSRNESAAQFQLGDHRPLAEVIKDISERGYIPSFCTACYRTGRTGHDFMDLAKPGAIKAKCGPNALSTYLEYLLDYHPDELAVLGRNTIQSELICMSMRDQKAARALLEKVEQGQRDVFC
jgi:2-iminoacetate synthase